MAATAKLFLTEAFDQKEETGTVWCAGMLWLTSQPVRPLNSLIE